MTEEKEYLTFEEAADYLGKKRASLYIYIKQLGIKPYKFNLDRRSYLALEDVKRMKEALSGKPWVVGEKSETSQVRKSKSKKDAA